MEAKRNDQLGSSAAKTRDAARKRALIGAYLVADEILLGTTQMDWSPRSVTAMTDANRHQQWRGGVRPTLRLLTGLGTETVTDEVVDLDTGQRSPRPARWS